MYDPLPNSMLDISYYFGLDMWGSQEDYLGFFNSTDIYTSLTDNELALTSTSQDADIASTLNLYNNFVKSFTSDSKILFADYKNTEPTDIAINATIKEIQQQLIEYTKINPNLIIKDKIVEKTTNCERQIYAQSGPDVVRLDKKVLLFAKDLIAIIMAHEWGHHVAGHYIMEVKAGEMPKPLTAKEYLEGEYVADEFAGEFVAKHGYEKKHFAEFNLSAGESDFQLERNRRFAVAYDASIKEKHASTQESPQKKLRQA